MITAFGTVSTPGALILCGCQHIFGFFFHFAPLRWDGCDYRFAPARAFFPARQELAVAQTACRASQNALAWPSHHTGLAKTMIKADGINAETRHNGPNHLRFFTILPFKNNAYKVDNGSDRQQRGNNYQKKGAGAYRQIEGGRVGQIQLKKNGYCQKNIFNGFMNRHIIKAPR
jgi:hypothetical protein